jgi:hypothetical protein
VEDDHIVDVQNDDETVSKEEARIYFGLFQTEIYESKRYGLVPVHGRLAKAIERSVQLEAMGVAIVIISFGEFHVKFFVKEGLSKCIGKIYVARL